MSSRTAIKVLGRNVIEPAKPKWCCAMPTAMVGPTRAPAASPTPRAITSAQIASVPIRPVGPCCSVEPIGRIMARLDRRYASTSIQVCNCSCIHQPFIRALLIATCDNTVSARPRPMKIIALFGCIIALSLGGCSGLPSAGPMASEVAAQGQAGKEVLFDVVPVDEHVVATLLAQPKESFHARFKKAANPPELKIAVGDTVSVTIWESAAGGLFTPELPPLFPGSRPSVEPLAPESPPTAPVAPAPETETPGGLPSPFNQLFGPPTPSGPPAEATP